MLDFNHFWKADKTPSINYILLESFFKGIDGYKYNFEKPPTAKEGEYISFGYLMSRIWKFCGIRNKYDGYRGHNCMKEFSDSLGEHALKLINSEKKKMVRLTNKEYQYILNQRNCHICKK